MNTASIRNLSAAVVIVCALAVAITVIAGVGDWRPWACLGAVGGVSAAWPQMWQLPGKSWQWACAHTAGRQETQGRSAGLDLLRILLAVSVIVLHWASFCHIPTPTMLSPVQCFICLSGFLIPSSYVASRDALHFAWKRFLRVAPAFWLSFALLIAILGTGAFWPTMNGYLHADLMAPGNSNAPLWSLMCEEMLYALFALLMLTGCKWGKPSAWLTLAASVAAWYVIRTTAHDTYYSLVNSHEDHYLSLPVSFCVGAVIAQYKDRLSRMPLWLLLPAIPFLDGQTMHALSTSSVYAIAYEMTVAAVPLLAAMTLPLRLKMPDLTLGTYCYHYPILLALVGCGMTGYALLAAVLTATLTLAAVSWYGVERYALRLKDWQPLVVVHDRRRLTGAGRPECVESRS